MVEPQLRAGHLDEAQRSLTAFFTSPTSFFLQVFDSEPLVAREHLETFSDAYQAYHDQCVAARNAHLRDNVLRWPFTGLKHNGKIDEDGHAVMTIRWAKNVVRLVRRVKAIRQRVRLPLSPHPATSRSSLCLRSLSPRSMSSTTLHRPSPRPTARLEVPPPRPPARCRTPTAATRRTRSRRPTRAQTAGAHLRLHVRRCRRRCRPVERERARRTRS